MPLVQVALSMKVDLVTVDRVLGLVKVWSLCKEGSKPAFVRDGGSMRRQVAPSLICRTVCTADGQPYVALDLVDDLPWVSLLHRLIPGCRFMRHCIASLQHTPDLSCCLVCSGTFAGLQVPERTPQGFASKLYSKIRMR